MFRLFWILLLAFMFSTPVFACREILAAHASARDQLHHDQADWEPSNFTRPWSNTDYQRIVHMFDPSHPAGINYLNDPKVVAQNPILSTSLITPTRREVHGLVGFSLRVPRRNIYAAATHDIHLQNQIGQFSTAEIENYLLSVHRDTRLPTPASTIRGTRRDALNEIVVTGTNLEGTGEQVEPFEIVVVTFDGTTPAVNPAEWRRIQRASETHNLPIRLIRHSALP